MEVWSSGSETWTPCHGVHIAELEFLYSKNVGGKVYLIHRNELGQYFRCEVPDECEEE